MTAPAPPKTVVRKKRRAAARPTAHIGYQPAGPDLYGRRVRADYHAIADQTVTGGTATCYAGEALCGTAWRWEAIPDGLFPPTVSCPVCQRIAAAGHITITGPDA
jgi:hypothetical protein